MYLITLFALTIAQLNTYGAKVVLVAGAVHALVELLKKIPTGSWVVPVWVKVLLNLSLTTAGVLMVTSADQIFTIQTLTAILLAAGSAAGIHGTAKSLTAPAVEPLQVPNGGNPAVGAKDAS